MYLEINLAEANPNNHLTLIKFGLPYIIAWVAGSSIGLLEIFVTFPNYIRYALFNKWASLLIAVNGFFGLIIFSIIFQLYKPRDIFGYTLLPIIVGLFFPVIIRTHFDLAKLLDKNSELSIPINLAWLYDKFQKPCKTKIDTLVIRKKAIPRINQLIENYTIEQIYILGIKYVRSARTMSETEKQQEIKELENIFNQANARNQDSIKIQLASKVENYFGDQLLDSAILEQQGISRSDERNTLAKKIVYRFTLEYVVEIATKLLSSEKDREKVRNWYREEKEGLRQQRNTIVFLLLNKFSINEVAAAFWKK